MSVPLASQIACIKREILFRRRLYPRWVERGRMTKAEAHHEVLAMESVLATVMQVYESRPYRLEPPPGRAFEDGYAVENEHGDESERKRGGAETSAQRGSVDARPRDPG